MDHTSNPRAGLSEAERTVDVILTNGPSVADSSRVYETAGDADTLSAMLAHFAGVKAAADYRLLVTASQLHDECEEEYLVALAEHRGEKECDTAEFAEHARLAAAGSDPFEKYGPSGIERAIAYLGAAVNVTPGAARRILQSGDALRNRLPLTGRLLAEGRIDRARFDAAVVHTELVAESLVADVDAALADDLSRRPAMAFARFVTLVDTVVAKIDPEAAELRRENVARDRDVTVRPDRRVPGQSRINGRLTTVDGARVDAALNGMADSVHADDPRTRAQRRTDALIAMTRGETLTCECGPCIADHDSSRPAPDVAPRPAAGWFHIIVDLATLLGANDDPAYCDGHGLIDAAQARELLAEAERSYVHSASAEGRRTGHTYQASPGLADLVRCGELWCAFPGCGNRAWNADLDHIVEFAHDAPASGGPTSAANLVPLCRLHHRIKTFTDWRDYRDPQGYVVMISPAGRLTLGTGFTGRDLFPHLGDTPPPGDLRCFRDRAERERERLRKKRLDREDGEDPPPY